MPMFTPVSVSYTHLDVYKRQAKNFSDCSQPFPLFQQSAVLKKLTITKKSESLLFSGHLFFYVLSVF